MANEHVSLTRNYGNIRFERGTLSSFFEEAKRIVGDDDVPGYSDFSVQRGSEAWRLPTLEQFLTEIGYGYGTFSVTIDWGTAGRLTVAYDDHFVASIAAPDRNVVEDFAQFVLGKCGEGEHIRAPIQPLRVFIGHGRSDAWKDLKNHLTDIHHIEVEAYEVASRGGFTIREVLDTMLSSSTLAFLLMTAEDAQDDGGMRARQNVVHEAGLFQGRLGFQRAVILKERGVEMMTNLDGIQYIEFAAGNIRETFGDVIGVVQREFPDR